MTAATMYTAEYYDLQRPHSQDAQKQKSLFLFLSICVWIAWRLCGITDQISGTGRSFVCNTGKSLDTIVPLAGQRQQCHPYTVVGSL
jgi:hypothetical protein